MQTAKIEFLTKFNDIVTLATKASRAFPDRLCEYIVDDFELQAVVLFKVLDGNKLSVLGKSGDYKKTFSDESISECYTCNSLRDNSSAVTFNSQNDCQMQASEFVIYEGCLYLKISDTEKVLIKIAKKTPFTKADRENLEKIGKSISTLVKIWMGHKGSGTSSVSEIITEIAHELRTPTNSIMGFASLLNEDNLTASQTEYVGTLKESAYNLLSLLNDLIELSKIETGTAKETTSQINIREFINDVVKLFSEKNENSTVDFLINVESQIPETLKLDTQKLRYILVNIITYSLRMTEKGKISISVTLAASNRLCIRISDTSSGISGNKLKDVFKPFSLNELSNSKIGNATGLGLALSKKYITLLNGHIEVASTIGKGNIFTILAEAESLSPIEAQINSLPKSKKKNRVLVVEDDYATSKLLSNYLNKWGYEPVIVNSAEQALKSIDKEIFLAVLMDIILPDANGFELLKNIREHKNAKNTPVIVCSVEAEQQKAFLMGAVEYFVKPIKYKYLVEVLTSYKLKKDSNILIVDDDVPTLNLIKEAVDQAGYNALAEAHSSKVMEKIKNVNLDLAIIDLDMPEVSGFDLIKEIKTQSKFAKLPIIIYTGKENYKEDLKRIDGLFADLLHKSSSNIEDLADTINEMINKFDEPTKPEDVQIQKDAVKILLVEDYKHSQIIVTRLLKKNSFESIVVVENGQEALEQAKHQQYDLILMDMQMPVMNGFEATEKIRQLANYRDTPIIALTAFAMKGDREKCLEAGATDYIPKPIDSQEFIEKVKFYTESKVSVT
jgi:CheY-like chemotaxis protein/nitrogen-specific signal transduction histidine kinase